MPLSKWDVDSSGDEQAPVVSDADAGTKANVGTSGHCETSIVDEGLPSAAASHRAIDISDYKTTAWWAKPMREALRVERSARGEQIRTLRMATGCSGTEAPAFGMQARPFGPCVVGITCDSPIQK